MGVDSLLQLARGEAIQFSRTVDGDGGQETTASFKLITSQQELVKSLDIAVSASVRYGLASVDARMDFAQEHAVNDASVHLVLNSTCTNAPKHMEGAELKPSVERLYDIDPEGFHRAFGDCYVDEIYTGGSLTVLYMFHTRDETSKTKISASLNAQIGSFISGGSVSGNFASAVAEAQRTSELEMKVFMSGGRGVATPTSVEEALHLFHTFPAEVLGAGTPYRVTAKPWEEFPLPPGLTLAQRVARRDTIETCGKNVLAAIENRSRAEYIIANPSQYLNPDVSALTTTRDQMNTMISKWSLRAGECSEDITKCSLEGLSFPAVSWPTRIATRDPLGAKIEEVRLHDSKAAPFFQPQNFPGLPLSDQFDIDPNREGRWRFAVNSEGKIWAGVFWCPEWGAHVVYGPIFLRYLRLGHTQGPCGYPRNDEIFYRHEPGDDIDPSSREQSFEHDTIWWNARDNRVMSNLGSPEGLSDVEHL